MTDQLSPNETLAAMAAARRRGWNRDKMTLACWIAQKVQPQPVPETAGTRTLPGADAMSSQADRPLRQASVPPVESAPACWECQTSDDDEPCAKHRASAPAQTGTPRDEKE